METPGQLETGLEGFRFWPGALGPLDQTCLLAQVRAAVAQAPFYRPETPGGRPFSVLMTNCGPLGWVSDRTGYRYQPLHPLTGRPWPPIPPLLLALWDRLTGLESPPDACLVNLYRGPARMGLHQDRDEADLTAPVLSAGRVRSGPGSRAGIRALDQGFVTRHPDRVRVTVGVPVRVRSFPDDCADPAGRPDVR